MKEIEYLKIINKTLSDSSLLGDDCAFLDAQSLGNSGLYVTHDSLVEDVHFRLGTTTPYLLGQKSVNVNLSDLAAACAEPLFITVSLSLPKTQDDHFVRSFYEGVNDVCKKYNLKVAGGDITGAEKVFVSICAIGKKTVPFLISRKTAKAGDVVVTTGFHGDSAGGLKLLTDGKKTPDSLIEAHLNPQPQLEKSRIIAEFADSDFAMMDTSDGLADALFKISKESNVSISVDFDDIPISAELKKNFDDSFKSLALWGGEDYQLLFCTGPSVFEKLDSTKFFKIGNVEAAQKEPIVKVKDGDELFTIDEQTFERKSFNHFEDGKSEKI